MTEKSVFREAWSPEMTSHRSQSRVGLAVLYPIGSEIWRFWYIKTRGRKIAIEKFLLLYLSVHWGDFIEQIKKSVLYTLRRRFALIHKYIYFLLGRFFFSSKTSQANHNELSERMSSHRSYERPGYSYRATMFVLENDVHKIGTFLWANTLFIYRVRLQFHLS